MRKLRPLKRLPVRLRASVAASSPAIDADFCEVGVPAEALEHLSIDDETRRGLAAMLSLKDPVRSLRATDPDASTKLKDDAIILGRWVDGRLPGCLRTVESVKISRLIRAAKSSAAVIVSDGLMDQYGNAF